MSSRNPPAQQGQTEAVAPDRRPLWVTIAVLALHGAGLLGGGIFLLVRSTGHDATNHRAAVVQGIFALVGALIFLALAAGLAPPRASLLARTPTAILEVILLPVSIGVLQSGRFAIGVPLLLSAIAALVGLALGGRDLT